MTTLGCLMRLSHRIPRVPWRAATPWALRPRMVVPLICGLALFGFGEGLLVLSHWGATPWTVLAQGVARHLHLPLGWATFAISATILMAWWPLHERPGFGTLANVVIIALVLDVTASSVSSPATAAGRAVLVAGAVVAIGVGSALYLTTGLGPGPRDGLMTSLHRRWGVSVVYVRVGLEVTVLSVGWLLGGTVGVGTAVFASTIGFSIGASLRALEWVVSRVSA